jgi:hypothetical protein
MSAHRIFGGITKVEDQADGSIKVFGVASSGARDDAGEIVTPGAMKAALPDYALYPALREMHQPSAAGRTLEAEVDADGFTRIVAHVVDPIAISKVKSKTYGGFSIGGKVLQRDPADRSIITAIKLSEISLVDRPCNPEASIDLWKADLGENTPMPYAPTNDEVKARAAELAKAADKPDRAKDYLVKAREELIAEHVEQPDAAAILAAALAKAKEADKPYGDVEYADPKNGKYPIDTAKHIKAAWSYINMPKNQEGYTAAEVDAIKAKIVAAWKDKIDPDGPPSAEKMAAVGDLGKAAAALRLIVKSADGKLTKGLYSVARLCEIIEALTWLQQDVTWEATAEGDKSPQPAELADNVAALLTTLAHMLAEESAEVVDAYQQQGMDIDIDASAEMEVMGLATSIIDLAKADEALMAKVGARNSKADQANIQAAHDAMAKLGAMCDPGNCPADEADKAAKATAAESLKKLASDAAETLAKQAGDLAELRKHAAGEADRTAAAINEALEKFRKEPLAPRTAASNHAVIGKAQDANPETAEGPTDEDVQKWLAGLTPEERAHELMKASMRLPVRVAA